MTSVCLFVCLSVCLFVPAGSSWVFLVNRDNIRTLRVIYWSPVWSPICGILVVSGVFQSPVDQLADASLRKTVENICRTKFGSMEFILGLFGGKLLDTRATKWQDVRTVRGGWGPQLKHTALIPNKLKQYECYFVSEISLTLT